MKKEVFQNWLWKLVSIICALVIWFVISEIDDPTETKTFTNIPVTFKNTEVITDDNKDYEVLDKSDVLRYVQIQAPHSVIREINESDINAVADFSKMMKMDNTVEIKISSNRHNDSIDFKASSNELKLNVEDKIVVSFPVSVECVGELKKGYIVGGTTSTINRIEISGAESHVKNVAKVVAEINIDGTSGDSSTYANIVLYDKEGDSIDDEKLTLVNNPRIQVTVDVLATKMVPVTYITPGIPTEGYAVAGLPIGSISELLIAGEENVIANVEEIVVSGDALFFEQTNQDVKLSVDIDNYLPEGVRRADTSGGGFSDVEIKISPIIEKEFTLQMSDVEILNVPEAYDKVVHVEDKVDFVVKLRGAELLLNEMDEDDVKATVDITKWMESQNMSKLEEDSTYKLIPDYDIPVGIEVISDNYVEVIAKLED